MSFSSIKKYILLSAVLSLTSLNITVVAQESINSVTSDNTQVQENENDSQNRGSLFPVKTTNDNSDKQINNTSNQIPVTTNASSATVQPSQETTANVQQIPVTVSPSVNQAINSTNSSVQPSVIPSTQVSAVNQTAPVPSANVSVVPTAKNVKSSDWVNNQVSNLDKNGVLKVPDWVDYDSLVSQKDFSIMLSKATGIKDRTIFGDIDQNGFDKPLSRAMAIDAALRAFGLEKEMDRVIQDYKTKFKDITPEQKYYKASLTAEIIKLSAGYPDGTFRPNDLLKWSESVAIVESIYRWASLMPTQTPIQKAEDMRKNIWYYFIDGFRLILTSIYCLLSIAFLYRAWKRSKSDKTGLRPIIASLCFATLFLFIMWLNEMLYGRGLIEKSIYYIISTISVLAGMFLIRTSNLITKQTEPKPKATIEVGYVDHIDLSRGEMFVIDSITKRRMLALISPDTKIYNRENRLLGAAFFSEIGQGDFVSIKGTEQISGGAIIDIDMLLVLASKQNNNVTKTNTRTQVNEQEQNQVQNKYKRVT